MNDYEILMNKAKVLDDAMLKAESCMYIERFYHRNMAMVALHDDGLTYAFIAKLVGLHHERVRQIILRWREKLA